MAHEERMQTECPPDAHKVIRPPENEVKATIVVKLNEAELEKYGIADLCSVIALMSAKPLVMCSDDLRAKIEEQKKIEEIEPCYLVLDDESTAHISYADGSVGPSQAYVDLEATPAEVANFFEHLGKKQFVIIDSLSMLILRSISTVYPWDKLLAGDFLRQYLSARGAITADDEALLIDIRYGRVDGFSIKETHKAAYQYLRLERKLFLQYPTEDDD